jgi:methionyl aminopeptidase
MISDEVIEKYVKAGKIAKGAISFARDYVSSKKKVNLYVLAEEIEKFILRKGAKPAFPCNISVDNIAAHYTPLSNMDGMIDTTGIIKIDIGVHIDGYIADTAISISNSKRHRDILKLNKRILDEILRMMKPGVKTGTIGEYVESTAKARGYKPISNLSGHLIDKYSLHAGKHIPNVKQFISPTIKEGEVYAVEPFLTYREGAGSVEEAKDDIRIYSLVKIKKEKDPDLEKMRSYIFKNFSRLPFTPRWLYNEFGDNAVDYIHKLYIKKAIRGYPVLIERKGAPVSQFEHTVIILEKENIVISR